jgi:hypothetical protein
MVDSMVEGMLKGIQEGLDNLAENVEHGVFASMLKHQEGVVRRVTCV